MPSRYEETILRSLRRLTRAIDLHSKRLANHHALTGPQLVCLRQIFRDEVTTPSALAKQVSLSQGTVTGILDRMEKRGLVTRTRSETDKRRVLVELTGRGRELVGAAPSPLHEEFSARLERLPDGEQAMIDWILNRVVDMMEAGAVDAAPMLSSGPVTADVGEVERFLDDTE